MFTGRGYLLSAFGLGGKSGAWALANLGVLVALAFSSVATLLLTRSHAAPEGSLA